MLSFLKNTWNGIGKPPESSSSSTTPPVISENLRARLGSARSRGDDPGSSDGANGSQKKAVCMGNMERKFPYSRPDFLGMGEAKVKASLNHGQRMVVSLPGDRVLPRHAGYAECVNAGKSQLNEDQACAVSASICGSLDGDPNIDIGKFTLFGVFDGHAGPDVALIASHELHRKIQERLVNAFNEIVKTKQYRSNETPGSQNFPWKRPIALDSLVVGALEAAFHDMDVSVREDTSYYLVKGGCAVVVALFYAGQLFVANAGDCRAVACVGGNVVPMSNDFTPESERRRLQQLGESHPELLGKEFTPRQFCQRVVKKDIGSEILYRDSHMDGWANRLVTEEDTRFPLICGEGKRARLMATIGVSRGFGDHDLKVFDSNIAIKPFLTCTPQVKIHSLNDQMIDTCNYDDVLIMGSDGLWDVITNEEAVKLVCDTLRNIPTSDPTRYTKAAGVLLTKTRGLQKNSNFAWMLEDKNDYASHDDITCFVIPLNKHQFPVVQEEPELSKETKQIGSATSVNQDSSNQSGADSSNDSTIDSPDSPDSWVHSSAIPTPKQIDSTVEETPSATDSLAGDTENVTDTEQVTESTATRVLISEDEPHHGTETAVCVQGGGQELTTPLPSETNTCNELKQDVTPLSNNSKEITNQSDEKKDSIDSMITITSNLEESDPTLTVSGRTYDCSTVATKLSDNSESIKTGANNNASAAWVSSEQITVRDSAGLEDVEDTKSDEKTSIEQSMQDEKATPK